MASCLLLAEQALNSAGSTLYGGTFDTRVDTIPILIIVSGVLIGPLFEEIVFRGAALRTFEKGGKVFAILISYTIRRFIKDNPLRSAWLWIFLAGNFIWASVAIQKL